MQQLSDAMAHEPSSTTRYAMGRDESVSQIIPRVDLDLGEVGEWRLERVEISTQSANLWNLRAGIDGRPGDTYVTPGVFTQLWQDRRMWMSDTYSERNDHLRFVKAAHGQVLMAGLGLGTCIDPVLAKPEVEHLTILEIEPDVIQLVGEQYRYRYPAHRLTIIEADALTWHPGDLRFDVIWFDIWLNISTDNRESMTKLHRRYARWKKSDGWMDSWKRWEIDAQRERERRSYW